MILIDTHLLVTMCDDRDSERQLLFSPLAIRHPAYDRSVGFLCPGAPVGTYRRAGSLF